jgi:cytochrome oxidase Cu insertion factor (SCO1/SenC/PrrC family)
LAGGCAGPAVHHGRVVGSPGGQSDEAVRPAVGASFVDFSYVDDEGKPQRLKDHLGDYTFLIFTRCGDDLHSLASQEIRELVHATQDRDYNEIIAFDIYWSEAGCEGDDPCRLAEPDSSYFSICDARGEVASLYGVAHQNEIIVVGPDGRIVDGASVASLEELKARVRERIEKYTAYKREYLAQVYY